MRRRLVLMPLILAGCSSGGTDVGTPFQPVELAQHVPQIADLELSPATAIYMAGDGSVPVEAQFSFTDSGLDIATIQIDVSDGTSLTLAFPEAISTETGTHIETLDMSTVTVGSYILDVWLVDKLGVESNHATANFEVIAAAAVTEWTNQLTGLPFVLNDVVWDGHYFIAVGDAGAVLTSADGLVWTEQDTGVDFDLFAVANDGIDVVAVGKDGNVLLSSDHGQSWSTKSVGHPGSLRAVTINAPQIVAGGMAWPRQQGMHSSSGLPTEVKHGWWLSLCRLQVISSLSSLMRTGCSLPVLTLLVRKPTLVYWSLSMASFGRSSFCGKSSR